MDLDNVNLSHGRIIPSDTNYDSITNKGVNFHNNWFSRAFVRLFGSGVVKVHIDGTSFYLNKASCFKLVNSTKTIDKSSKEYKNFIVQNPDQIVIQVQEAINQIRTSPLFSGQMHHHLSHLLGKQVIEKAPIYNQTDKDSFEDPTTYISPIMKGLWENTPFIALKVVPSHPEEYFRSFDEKTIARVAKTPKERIELKKTRLNEIPFESHLIILRQENENQLWTNLGDSSLGAPTFFTGRSYAYNIQNPPEEIDEMRTFFHSLLAGDSAADAHGIKWKLSPFDGD